MTLTRGTFVTLTIGAWTHPGMVTLASPNSDSLVVMFDGAAPVGDGLMVGMLFLLREDDGVYYELATHTAVGIEARASVPPPTDAPVMLLEGDPWVATGGVSEDRCAVCDQLLGIGIKALHLGMCEACRERPTH